MRYRSLEVKVGGVVYKLRAHADEDGRVRIQVRGGERQLGS